MMILIGGLALSAALGFLLVLLGTSWVRLVLGVLLAVLLAAVFAWWAIPSAGHPLIRVLKIGGLMGGYLISSIVTFFFTMAYVMMKTVEADQRTLSARRAAQSDIA
jgi:hypothetical protein